MNNPLWTPQGLIWGEKLIALWPETGTLETCAISVVDADGKEVDRLYHLAGWNQDLWKKIREQMPDDALYFQPEGAGKPSCGTASKIKENEVYRFLENAQANHLDRFVLPFAKDQIKKMKFLDLTHPKLFFSD